jgi:hypothetical protein
MKKRFLIWLLMGMLFSKALSMFGVCQNKDQYCLACDSDSKCLLCVNSLLTSDGTCQHLDLKISHCLIYDSKYTDPSNLVCKECVKGYKIIQGKCQKIETKFCLQIKDENQIVNTTHSISVISTKKTVKHSKNGFERLLQTAQTSAESEENTVSYSETCSVCSSNMLPHFGKCKNISLCSIQNCLHCFHTGLKQQKCIECAKGYTLKKMWNDTNYCVLINKNTMNCLYMETNSEKLLEYCAICKINFYNFQGNCLKSDLYELTDYDIVSDQLSNIYLLKNSFLLFVLVLFSFDLKSQ